MFDHAIVLYLFSFDSLRYNTQIILSHLMHHEIKKAYSYKTKQLQENYIIARAVIRQILSENISLPPSEIIFTKNAFGKPCISTHQNQNNIYFNISHSKDILCIGVAKVGEIGVDIEFKDEYLNIGDVQDLCLSHEEKKFMSTFETSSLKIDFFYKIWTLKESIVKAVGCGMSYEINKINLIDAKYHHTSKIADKVIVEMPDNTYTIYAQNLNRNCTSVPYSLNNYCISIASSFKPEKITFGTCNTLPVLV